MSTRTAIIALIVASLAACSAPSTFNTDNIDEAVSQVSVVTVDEPDHNVVADCDTHENTVRALRADGYHLVSSRSGVDVYRLTRIEGVTGAGAEDEQTVHRLGSRDCIYIEETH